MTESQRVASLLNVMLLAHLEPACQFDIVQNFAFKELYPQVITTFDDHEITTDHSSQQWDSRSDRAQEGLRDASALDLVKQYQWKSCIRILDQSTQTISRKLRRRKT